MRATGREGLTERDCEFVAPRGGVHTDDFHFAIRLSGLAWVGSIRACREPPVCDEECSRIMRRTRCTLPLVLLTFLSDLPFAVHGLDLFGLFLFLLVLIFSGVAHASAPV